MVVSGMPSDTTEFYRAGLGVGVPETFYLCAPLNWQDGGFIVWDLPCRRATLTPPAAPGDLTSEFSQNCFGISDNFWASPLGNSKSAMMGCDSGLHFLDERSIFATSWARATFKGSPWPFFFRRGITGHGTSCVRCAWRDNLGVDQPPAWRSARSANTSARRAPGASWKSKRAARP